MNHKIIYEIKYKLLDMIPDGVIRIVIKKHNFIVEPPNKTIETIIKNKISVSRWGDGEFNIMCKKRDACSFQSYDKNLRDALWDAWKEENTSYWMKAMPVVMFDSNVIAKLNSRLWKYQIIRNLDNLHPKGVYLDSLCFRFNILLDKYMDKVNYYEYMKSIWNRKDIIIIEGRDTKFGCQSNLISNACSVHRVLIPNKDCYQKVYGKLKEWIIREIEKKYLILAIAGSMATVLSFELSKIGYWIIDLGQAEKEYIKLVGNTNSNIKDDEYYLQILKEF